MIPFDIEQPVTLVPIIPSTYQKGTHNPIPSDTEGGININQT